MTDVATAAVVLAAGRAERFGGRKQLAALDGRPILQHVVDAAVAAGLGEIVVVVGHDADEVVASIALPATGRFVRNDDYGAGMSTSLRAGIEALGEGVTDVVVLLGDQPTIDPGAIREVVGAHTSAGAEITRARYADGPGHPVVFARSVWPEVDSLRGDAGARVVVDQRPERVLEVAVASAAPPDVDTRADHAALARRPR